MTDFFQKNFLSVTKQKVAEDDGLSYTEAGKNGWKSERGQVKKAPPVGGQNSWELGGVEMEFLRII